MRRTGMTALVMVVLLLAPSLLGEEVIERYRGFAVAMGTVATGARSTIDIGIYRWTPDEERAKYLGILKEQGAEKLHEALFDADEVAFMKISGGMGYKLKLARDVTDAKGVRHLIFVADRPITFREMRTSTNSEDYNFSIVELALDAEGKGEGALALGVEVKWNEEKDVPELTTMSSEPVRIMNVEKVKN